ncbi:MAG TPA: tetratricopeptide repeat protein, partial [Streptosporangiaceae bacterium]|nr:tetratricopeptide repeat protein [Streptosporangiaceae bacterium]
MQQPRNFSLYGAVDLGARQAATQRQQASAAASQGAARSEYVFDVTEATFEADVLERSRTVPVIMDLWAEWCGPCKQLSPVLERLANEAAGTWVLAKVDVDANPQLSAALQVQSIPMVVGVIGGQLVPGFLGALPEAQVRQWLGQVLQVAQELGMPGGGPPGDLEDGADADGQPGQDSLREPELAEAQQAMERGDLDAAAGAFERLLVNSPGHPVATVGLAQLNLLRRVNSYDQAQARKDAAAHPGDVDAQIRVADIEMSLGNAEEAFDRLLGVIRRTAGDDRNKVRQHLVGLFDMFPPRDPRVS